MACILGWGWNQADSRRLAGESRRWRDRPTLISKRLFCEVINHDSFPGWKLHSGKQCNTVPAFISRPTGRS